MASKAEPADVQSNSGRSNLISFFERIERLDEDKKQIGEDIKDVFSEAKGQGYDVKAMREVLRRRKMDRDARDQMDEIVSLYEGIFG